MGNPFDKFGISDAELKKAISESAEVDAELNRFMKDEVVPYWKSVSPVDEGRYAASIKVTKKAKGGKGEVGLFAGPDEIWAKLRVTGFKNTMEADFPDIKIVAEKAGGTKDAGIAAADWTKSHPDIHGIFTAADTMAVESIKSLTQAGATDKIKVSTSNLNDEARAALENGTLTCASLQPAVSMGRDAMREATAAIEGGKVLGRIEAPALLVTREKVATYDFSKIIAPADYQP